MRSSTITKRNSLTFHITFLQTHACPKKGKPIFGTDRKASADAYSWPDLHIPLAGLITLQIHHPANEPEAMLKRSLAASRVRAAAMGILTCKRDGERDLAVSQALMCCDTSFYLLPLYETPTTVLLLSLTLYQPRTRPTEPGRRE